MAKRNLALGLANLGQDLLSAYERGVRLREAGEERKFRQEERQYQRGQRQRERGLAERKLGLQERQLGLREKQVEQNADLLLNKKMVDYKLKRIKEGKETAAAANDLLQSAIMYSGTINKPTPPQVKYLVSEYMNLFGEEEKKYKPEDIEAGTNAMGQFSVFTKQNGKRVPVTTISKDMVEEILRPGQRRGAQQQEIAGWKKVPGVGLLRERDGQLEILGKDGLITPVTTAGEAPEARSLLETIRQEQEKAPVRVPFFGAEEKRGSPDIEVIRDAQQKLISAGVEEITMVNPKTKESRVFDVREVPSAFKRGFTIPRRGSVSPGRRRGLIEAEEETTEVEAPTGERIMETRTAARAAEPDMVKMETPDGRIVKVPRADVPRLLKAAKGSRVIGPVR